MAMEEMQDQNHLKIYSKTKKTISDSVGLSLFIIGTLLLILLRLEERSYLRWLAD